MEVIATPYQRAKTPLQTLFWAKYIDRSLSTFGNAYRTALVVGYTDNTARNITLKVWFKNGEDFYKDLLKQAENNLMEFLNLDPYEVKVKNGKIVGKKYNSAIGRIKWDTAKFVLTTIGKKRYNTKPYVEPAPANQSVVEIPKLKALFEPQNHKCPNCNHEF